MAGTGDPYGTVLEYASRLHDLEQTDHLLRWDSDVMMPPGGSPARSRQRATLSKLLHDLRSADELGAALDAVDPDDLDAGERANVRELRRQHDVASAVPAGVHDRLADVRADAHERWKEAKAADDWSRFAPAFERHIELRREWADHVDPSKERYAVLWEHKLGYASQPYVPFDTVEETLARVRDGLVPLVDAIRASDADLATEAFAERGPYDPDRQFAANEAILDLVGLDRSRARVDRAPHPFAYGNPFDVRLTTRVDEADPADAITSTMHEFGHATYHHGLPGEHYGTPLGRARGLTVHGSQSGIWENHVGRSRAFWASVLPLLREHFPQLEDVRPRAAYEAVNRVDPSNVIRTAADEVTYHLHVVVRTEIERALVAGDLAVEDVPRVWAEKYDDYLGVRPATDREGPLQDPHWAVNVPGFLNYTLGHGVLAAQLWAAMADDLDDVEALVREGRYGPVHDWLGEHVHRHGQRFRTRDLIERATGERLTAEPFLDYVERKYARLYDL